MLLPLRGGKKRSLFVVSLLLKGGWGDGVNVMCVPFHQKCHLLLTAREVTPLGPRWRLVMGLPKGSVFWRAGGFLDAF